MTTKNNDSDALKPFQEKRELFESHDPIFEAEIKSLLKSVANLRTDFRIIVQELFLKTLRDFELRRTSSL
ncbi:MAG: hypothetical protein M3O24_02085 [Thermoproteota archaeon]|nr:hypothetical protein [Thermoproteota archaeon]